MYVTQLASIQGRDLRLRHDPNGLGNVDSVPYNESKTTLRELSRRGVRKNRERAFFTQLQKHLYPAILSLALYACGGSDPAQTSAGQSGSLQSADEIAKMSHVDCSQSPLVGTWKAMRTYPNVYDQVTLRKDCLFETFDCGTLGYVDSEIKETRGIATVIYVRNQNDRDTCPAPGKYSCAYDAINPYYGELKLSCQLSGEP